MSTKEVGWAPANPWFEPGFEKAISVKIGEQSVRILPFTYFLATKFSAFTARGGRDPRMSHDFEDIVYLLNYTTNFEDKIRNSPDEDVKQYLIECFCKILQNSQLQEAIIGNLYYEDETTRFERIIEGLKRIVSYV